MSASTVAQCQGRCRVRLGTAGGALILAALATSPARAAPVYLQGATAPTGGIWVEDGIAPAGGHLWIADHLQGFCRLNPTSATNDQATLQTAGCKATGDGEPAYAPLAQLAFSPDGSSKSVGVMRLKLRAGLFNGGQTNFNNALPVADGRCKGNTLGGCRPTAAAFVQTNANGNGDLYVAVKRNGNVYRIRNVANGSGAPFTGAPSALQLVGQTSDGRGAQSLAFVGSDLYLAEGAAVTFIQDPSNIVPAATDGLGLCNNGTGRGVCVAEDPGFGFLGPLSVGSDGTHLFVGDATNPFQAVNVVDPATGVVTPFSDGGAYVNLSGFGFAPENAATARPARLFWADDPTGGAGILQGHWYSTPAADVVGP